MPPSPVQLEEKPLSPPVMQRDMEAEKQLIREVRRGAWHVGPAGGGAPGLDCLPAVLPWGACPRSHSRGQSEPGLEPGFPPPERSPSPVSAGVARREASARPSAVCPSTVCLSCSKGWRWSDGRGGTVPGSGAGGCLTEQVRVGGLGAESGASRVGHGEPPGACVASQEKAVTLGPLSPPAVLPPTAD